MKTNSAPHQQFVVTAFSSDDNKILRSQIWDTSHPLTFGHPIRWVLEKTPDGVRVRHLDLKLNQVEKLTPEEFSFADLKKNRLISLSKIKLSLHPVATLADLEEQRSKWVPQAIPNQEMDEAYNERYFKKSIQSSIVGMIVLGLICMAWPQKKQNPDELIPAQYAKVLLSPAFQSKSSAPKPQTAPAGSAGHINVVQAFESQTVKKSAQKLINGGSLALLARSSILSGIASKNQVNQIFDSHSKFDHSTAKLTGLSQPNSLKLGTLGGGGKNGNIGNGLGYAEGKKAGVQGQGTGFVALDTTELRVEEGLSADEVGRVIHSHLAEIRYCYESAMLRDPHIEGKMLVDFKIEGHGHVKTASVRNSNISDSGLEQCVISHLIKWKFPKPKGGVEVAVSYPFIFKTLDQ